MQFEVYYTTASKDILLGYIQFLPPNQLKTSQKQTIKLYNKEIRLQDNYTISSTQVDEENILQTIQSQIKDNRISTKIILKEYIKIEPMPQEISIVCENIQQYLTITEKQCKEPRNSTQTSNMVNNQIEPSQSETKLQYGNIISNTFYKPSLQIILQMMNKSNSSQKNKGDIAEIVSAPFTYIKGPDDKYIRNFIDTWILEETTTIANQNFTSTKKSLNIMLGYLPLYNKPQNIEEIQQKFINHPYYKILLPANDFISPQRYGIKSNVPAVDNSIPIYRISKNHLLIITRQDKIGYNMEDIIDMVNRGLIRLLKAIQKWDFCKNYQIDLIYTLAWSRTQPKNKQLIPPSIQFIYDTFMINVIDFINDHFAAKKYKNIRKQVYLSLFIENCLSNNVLQDSAALYKELSEQYTDYKQNFININNTITEMHDSREFHRLCDTAEYTLFIPSTYYVYSDKIDEIEKIISQINIEPLKNRMQNGLQNYKSLNIIHSDSDISMSQDVEDSLAKFIDWIREHPKEQEIPNNIDLDGCLGDSWLFEIAYDDYGNEKLIEESAVLAWIRYHHKQQIPQIMRFKGFQYKGYTDVTPISIWIQYRRYEPVPQYLIYSGCQDFYDFAGRNLLMNWMKYRPDEPIPDFLQGPDWEQTFDKEYGDLPATSWIKYGRGPIPSELQFKDWIKVYEDYQKSPEFIQHRVDKRAEEEGEYNIIPETVLHLWVKYRPGEEIPDEFLTGYPYSVPTLTAEVIYDSIVANKGALPPECLRFNSWEKIKTIEKNIPLCAWIESSDPKDANIPSELLYPNAQRTINYYGVSPLTWWVSWKNIKVTGIPERLLYKHCITSEFVEEWKNSQKKNTPIPQNVIKRHFGTAANYKLVYEKPDRAPEKPECCICFTQCEDLLYPCKNRHPDGAVCIDCYLQLIAQHSQCPLCRGKLL